MRLLALIALLVLLAAPARPALAQEAAPTSPDPRVKFKDGERYLRDLAESLEIPRSEICLELSRYDCADKAFRIVLGGGRPL